jgi:mannan endo-1,4-beta-mannosidase
MRCDDLGWETVESLVTTSPLSTSFSSNIEDGEQTEESSSTELNDGASSNIKRSRRRFLGSLPAAVAGSAVFMGQSAAASGEHHIAIRGHLETSYRFGVSGEFSEEQSVIEQDINGETVANGVVGCGQTDEYFYTGDITSFTMDGEGTVVIDGETADPRDLQSNVNSGEFVTVDDGTWTVDGKPYAAVGANSFWASYLYWDKEVIDEVLSELQAMGQNTLRIWGFGSGSEQLFQPQPEQYNETAFERLDYVIKAARKYDIRLIITLGNYWPDFGGMDQYVAWSDTATDRTDFYTDPTCKDLYRSYVQHVLTRTNSLTGTQYRDDPTIMMWELVNELRNPAADDRDASTLASWVDEMAGYIKQIDSNHLVSTGSEGFVFGPGEQYDEFGYWMNAQGTDFIRIHESEHIDAASMHLYPDHWQISSEATVQFIRDRAREAAETLNKPVYNGEFGKRVDRTASNTEEQMAARNSMYRTWYETMAETGVDGAQFWQLVPNSCASEGDAFTVLAPNDKATVETIAAGADMLRDEI